MNIDYTIEDYSDKAFAVFGDTKKIIDVLRDLGGTFNAKLKVQNSTTDERRPGWIFPKSKKDSVTKQIKAYINTVNIKSLSSSAKASSSSSTTASSTTTTKKSYVPLSERKDNDKKESDNKNMDSKEDITQDSDECSTPFVSFDDYEQLKKKHEALAKVVMTFASRIESLEATISVLTKGMDVKATKTQKLTKTKEEIEELESELSEDYQDEEVADKPTHKRLL